jgi:hypothetical protein
MSGAFQNADVGMAHSMFDEKGEFASPMLVPGAIFEARIDQKAWFISNVPSSVDERHDHRELEIESRSGQKDTANESQVHTGSGCQQMHGMQPLRRGLRREMP